MKILVTPNSFKESLNSIEVAKYIAKGLRKASRKFTITEVPLADGGTGTSYIITKAFDGEFVKCKVTGPMGESITATYGIIPQQRVAVVELAEAAGLSLVPKEKRNPLVASTTGVGELIRDANKRKYWKILLGIGDSATIDCGVGALSVLGVRFIDKNQQEITHNCKGLLDLQKIDMSYVYKHLARLKITIASDVKNVLTGRYGALVYATQKGANRKNLPIIHKALKRFKKVILNQFGTDLDKIPGSGAAGGIGGAFAALLNAEMFSGTGLVQGIVRLEDEIKTSDVIITGEGRIDKQSLYGKTLKRVVDLAYLHRKPVILIAGSITKDLKMQKKYRVLAQYSLLKSSKTIKRSMKNAPKLLEKLAYSVGKELLSFFCK